MIYTDLAHPLVALSNTLATAKSTTANGTAFDLGTVSSCQRLIGVLHVTQISARSIFTIQSATSSGFTSPSTRITFTETTAIGAELPTPVAGPIADHSFWRGTFTMSSSGAQKFLLGMAIR